MGSKFTARTSGRYSAYRARAVEMYWAVLSELRWVLMIMQPSTTLCWMGLIWGPWVTSNQRLESKLIIKKGIHLNNMWKDLSQEKAQSKVPSLITISSLKGGVFTVSVRDSVHSTSWRTSKRKIVECQSHSQLLISATASFLPRRTLTTLQSRRMAQTGPAWVL